jgi:hypothetical protein
MNSKSAKSIAILGISSSLLLIATLLPAANALELSLTSTVEVEAPKSASIVEPETVAALFGEDDLSPRQHQVRSSQLSWLWSLPLAARSS